MEQLDLGFIEKVQEPTNATVIHYIPHFPVFKDSATTKMRIVYDASAKTSPSALCLNDCLYTGPNLIQNLSSILIKFRKHKVAFVADIEKAFLQITLHQNDRDATRFLWLKDINKSFDDDNIQTFRFRRVLFGAAPSPFLLNATLQHHLHSKRDWIAEDLSEVLYMDNVVSGTSTDTKAKEYYIKSRNYLKEAGMNLRQWTTNSINLDQKIKEDKTEANKVVKVLGLVWDSENDSLSLAIDKLIEETKHLQNITKLITILTEVEAVLNSRPLTYTYVNTKEEGPLTPAHFLCDHRLLSLPDQQNSNEDYGNTTREELSRRAKYHETLIHSFWKTWQQEYLTGLREQYCKKRKAPNYTVSKGDVVLIHDHIRKRNQWKMAVVTTLYPGKDGLVRSVTLRTSSGQELNRPIEKLYPMEIQEEEEEIAPKDISTIKRPVRLAAVKAAQRIKEQCQ